MHVQRLKVQHSAGPLGNQTWSTKGYRDKSFQMFFFFFVLTQLHFSQLGVVFYFVCQVDCAVACQNSLLLAKSAHCEIGVNTNLLQLCCQEMLPN